MAKTRCGQLSGAEPSPGWRFAVSSQQRRALRLLTPSTSGSPQEELFESDEDEGGGRAVKCFGVKRILPCGRGQVAAEELAEEHPGHHHGHHHGRHHGRARRSLDGAPTTTSPSSETVTVSTEAGAAEPAAAAAGTNGTATTVTVSQENGARGAARLLRGCFQASIEWARGRAAP